MRFTFKTFVDMLELSTDQLDEVFGVFQTHDKRQQAVAAKRKEEFEARRAELAQRKKTNPNAGTSKEWDNVRDDSDPRKSAFAPRNTPRAASNGRRAESDWLAQFNDK